MNDTIGEFIVRNPRVAVSIVLGGVVTLLFLVFYATHSSASSSPGRKERRKDGSSAQNGQEQFRAVAFQEGNQSGVNGLQDAAQFRAVELEGGTQSRAGGSQDGLRLKQLLQRKEQLRAVQMNDKMRLTELLKQQNDNDQSEIHFNYPDLDGFTLLHLAVTSDQSRDIAWILLKYGASVDACDNARKQTPLHVACQCASLGCIRLLLDHGADIEAEDKSQMTPLHMVGVQVQGHPLLPKLTTTNNDATTIQDCKNLLREAVYEKYKPASSEKVESEFAKLPPELADKLQDTKELLLQQGRG